jgi:1-acyl-sn-glycerol-3-phosphate acyltransferase
MTYWLFKAILTPILRFLYRVRVEGLEHVPAKGPAIVASDHVSFCDSIFLPLVLRRRITFVAKAEYFEDPKTAWFFRALGQIPIKRGDGLAANRALESALEVLAQGKLFGIYPEGTRSPDGRLYKGHTGVARLALKSKAPVLAIAMIGTAEVLPIGRLRPRLFMPITVKISPPLPFGQFHHRPSDPLLLRQMTDEIMFQIAELSGQEYVNKYANRKDAAAASAVERPGPPGQAGANGSEPAGADMARVAAP